MHGVIPAAGRGSRLGSLTDDRPKPLVDVAGKPLLTHVFDALEPHVDEFVVVVGYRSEQIRDRYGDTYREKPITYTEQTPRRGLAEALLWAESAVDGSFVQLNADNVLRGNIGDLCERHRETAADATLLVERVSRERARRGGVVKLDNDEVVGLVEKPTEPPSRLSNTGCFAFSPRIFDGCRSISPSERGEYELADAITWLLDRGGRVECVTLDGWRVNVNTPADIRRVERRLTE